jgi:hypothetical protein
MAEESFQEKTEQAPLLRWCEAVDLFLGEVSSDG